MTVCKHHVRAQIILNFGAFQTWNIQIRVALSEAKSQSKLGFSKADCTKLPSGYICTYMTLNVNIEKN